MIAAGAMETAADMVAVAAVADQLMAVSVMAADAATDAAAEMVVVAAELLQAAMIEELLQVIVIKFNFILN